MIAPIQTEADIMKKGVARSRRPSGGSQLPGKWSTPTILDMGFRVIPRSEFLRHLVVGVRCEDKIGRWGVESGPEVVSQWHCERSAGQISPKDAPGSGLVPSFFGNGQLDQQR
jgi:hypothetical protein